MKRYFICKNKKAILGEYGWLYVFDESNAELEEQIELDEVVTSDRIGKTLQNYSKKDMFELTEEEFNSLYTLYLNEDFDQYATLVEKILERK